ncbi:hypothetical protein ACFOY2_34165 [Nonomuraea purpurea]|uniref:Uncharacterized protein n=1 Tax=Nonomuraea purpurea TaxID=1849276 RepID=A0ABV8GHI8_9ACTN
MRRLAAALLTACALAGAHPAAAAPAWVTDSECTKGGGKIVPVGQGKALCKGGLWDNEQIHFD